MFNIILTVITLSCLFLSGCGNDSSSGSAYAAEINPTKAETLVGSWIGTIYLNDYLLDDSTYAIETFEKATSPYFQFEIQIDADGLCEIFPIYVNNFEELPEASFGWVYGDNHWGLNDVRECSILDDEFLLVNPQFPQNPIYIEQRSEDKFVLPGQNVVLRRVIEN